MPLRPRESAYLHKLEAALHDDGDAPMEAGKQDHRQCIDVEPILVAGPESAPSASVRPHHRALFEAAHGQHGVPDVVACGVEAVARGRLHNVGDEVKVRELDALGPPCGPPAISV